MPRRIAGFSNDGVLNHKFNGITVDINFDFTLFIRNCIIRVRWTVPMHTCRRGINNVF